MVESGRRVFRLQSGTITVEFVLVMIASLALFVPAGEFFRLSLFDQALARATHAGVRAAAIAAADREKNPSKCGSAVVNAFRDDPLAAWLLDTDGDGSVHALETDSNADDWPVAGQEVQFSLFVDADLSDGRSFQDGTGRGCDKSSRTGRVRWIQIRSRIVVEPWSAAVRLLWPDGIRRQHFSRAALNQPPDSP